MTCSAYKLNQQGDNIQPWRMPSPILIQFIFPCLLLTVAFWTAYKFLRRQVRFVWYSHLINNFPLCCDPHCSVRSMKQTIFWNSLAFSMFQQMLPIWSLVHLPFLNPAWTSGSSRFTLCWSLAWKILIITLRALEMSAPVQWLEHSLTLPFLRTGMRIDLFQSSGHCWLFQIFWHIKWTTLITPSSRILNSFAGILSPPLALLAAVLFKTHWSSHSRISGSEWETTPLWLSGSLRYFFV